MFDHHLVYVTGAPRPRPARAATRGGDPEAASAPRCDAWEEAERFVLAFDLPGVTAEAIEVQVHDRVLSLRARRAAAPDGAAWHLAERPRGGYARDLALPEEADAAAIEATYREGVLTLVLPKVARARPRKVEVR